MPTLSSNDSDAGKGYRLSVSAHLKDLLPCLFHGKFRGFGRTISKHCIDRPLVGTGMNSSLKMPNSQTNLGKDLYNESNSGQRDILTARCLLQNLYICTIFLFREDVGCQGLALAIPGLARLTLTPLQFDSQIGNCWQAMFPAPHSSFTVRRTALCRPRTRPGHLELKGWEIQPGSLRRLYFEALLPQEGLNLTGPQHRWVKDVSHMTCVCACR